MKFLVYVFVFFLRRLLVNWRFLWLFLWMFSWKKFFCFIFLWLFWLFFSGVVYFFIWVIEGFGVLKRVVGFSFEVLGSILKLIYWIIRSCVFFFCFFIVWFLILIFYSLDRCYWFIGYVIFFFFTRVKMLVLFIWQVFFELFSDIWFIICFSWRVVKVGFSGGFMYLVQIIKLVINYKLIFIFLWRRSKLVFIRVVYRILKFFFFCLSYKYIFFLRRIYIYFIWRHLPFKNLIIGWFAEWVSNRWWLFKWIVRSVSWTSFFYDKFVLVYNMLIYKQINWFLVSLQNGLYWCKRRFNSSFLESIYKWVGVLHSRFIKYFSVGRYGYVGNMQVWKRNENFIFWRIYSFLFRGIIVVFVLVFGLLERCLSYIYAYWRLNFLMGLRIPFYWKYFRDGVVMPILNLDEIKPIVKMFIKKRERKYTKLGFVWIFFFIMYYVWIFLFIVARIVYVIIRCIRYLIRMVLWGIGRLIWRIGYYIGIWYIILVLKFFYWKLIAFFTKIVFGWCCIVWYFFFRFLVNFYSELIFSKFFWYNWLFNINKIINLISIYLIVWLKFIFIQLKSFLICLQKFFIKGGVFGFGRWLNIKKSFYRFRIWFVYFSLYSYFLAWWRFFNKGNSMYNLVIYRDFYTMWSLRCYILNNKGVLDYLRFFFWPQMDVYYRSAYVLQELLYLQVFRNLFRYRWFWADLRSYLWFFFNFVSFFFYFYFGSVHKVYLNGLFFRYLDIFKLFTIRRLIWVYVVEYVKISFYIKDNKTYIWYRQVKYLKGFNWGFVVKLRERFLMFFKRFVKLEDSQVIYILLQYLYSRGIEWFLDRLQRVFFSENLGLYYFFRVCTFFLDFRSRVDFLIEYKRLEYQNLMDRESFLARQFFALEMIFEDLRREDIRQQLRIFRGGESRSEDDIYGEILREKEEILKISMGETGPLRMRGWNYSGLRGEAGMHAALPNMIGNMINKYGKRVSAGSSLDYMAQYYVEGNMSERIKNYFFYYIFLVFVVMPWRVFDFICYWLFDIFFVFIFLYIYLYFRILVLVTFFSVFGVFWLIIKVLVRLVSLVIRFIKWFIKKASNIWQH